MSGLFLVVYSYIRLFLYAGLLTYCTVLPSTFFLSPSPSDSSGLEQILVSGSVTDSRWDSFVLVGSPWGEIERESY